MWQNFQNVGLLINIDSIVASLLHSQYSFGYSDPWLQWPLSIADLNPNFWRRFVVSQCIWKKFWREINLAECDVDNEFSVVAAIINIDEAQAQASMPILVRLN